MELILRTDIPKLGKTYDVVKVRAGYARNYLLPKGLALKVTKANIERIEREKKSGKLAQEKDKRRFSDLCNRLTGKSYTIPVLANEEEKLYASVSAKDIVEAIKLEGIDIEPDNVILASPINELGIYEVDLRLKYEITTRIRIWVVKK